MNTLNQLTAITTQGQQDPHTTFAYDDNGNMTAKVVSAGTATLDYDYENRLVKITYPDSGTTELVYDALGRRLKMVEKNAGGATLGERHYVYDGLDLIAELDGNDTLEAAYTHGPGVDDPLIVRYNGNDYFYQTNHQGSVTELMNADGYLAKRYRYDAFGNIISETGPTFNRGFTYTSRERHARSGFYYYRARFYDPQTGRFITPDPMGLLEGENLYPYIGNDPINFSDPFGFDGIHVSYRFYPVDTGYKFRGKTVRLPLGHAAVIAVDPDTGTTKYYEYGRYDKAKFGMARNLPIPDLVMKNGKPTEESLQALYDFLSKNYGKNCKVDATYYPDADYQKIIDFALERIKDENRDPYNKFTNNCKTFAREAIEAGRN